MSKNHTQRVTKETKKILRQPGAKKWENRTRHMPTPSEPPTTKKTKSQNIWRYRYIEKRVTHTQGSQGRVSTPRGNREKRHNIIRQRGQPKKIIVATKTFDGFRSCSNHHPYGSLPVNSLNNSSQGMQGYLRVVIR